MAVSISATVSGRLFKDCEFAYSQNGLAVVKFSLPTEYFDGEKKTTWVTVVLFGKQGEGKAQFLRKGAVVQCSGELRVSQWHDRNKVAQLKVDLIASSVGIVIFPEKQEDVSVLTEEELDAQPF